MKRHALLLNLFKPFGFDAKQYSISTQMLDIAIKTERNSFRTANTTDNLDAKLDAIERNARKLGGSLYDNYLRI